MIALLLRLWLGAFAALCSCTTLTLMAQTPEPAQRPKGDEVASIGVARMRPDGTIELYLRASAGPQGPTGHGLLEYPPGHPHYEAVLRHLGGLAPGEVKSVPPWPD